MIKWLHNTNFNHLFKTYCIQWNIGYMIQLLEIQAQECPSLRKPLKKSGASKQSSKSYFQGSIQTWDSRCWISFATPNLNVQNSITGFWKLYYHHIYLRSTDLMSSWLECLGFRVQDIYPRHFMSLKNASGQFYGRQIQGFVKKSSLDLWIPMKYDGSAFTTPAFNLWGYCRIWDNFAIPTSKYWKLYSHQTNKGLCGQ